jgi:hypothetical protein
VWSRRSLSCSTRAVNFFGSFSSWMRLQSQFIRSHSPGSIVGVGEFSNGPRKRSVRYRTLDELEEQTAKIAGHGRDDGGRQANGRGQNR